MIALQRCRRSGFDVIIDADVLHWRFGRCGRILLEVYGAVDHLRLVGAESA